MFLKNRDNKVLGKSRAKLPTPKLNIEMPKDVKPSKQPLQYKNVINISGIDPNNIQDLKLELAKFNFGTLNGIQVNINEKGERTKIFITLENSEYIDTFADETIDEINLKLNSNEEFIRIGNLNVKRKSVISVLKSENKCEEKS